MGYGVGDYGERGYGGSSFEAGTPQIDSSNPLNGDIDVDANATVTFTVSSDSGLDEFSLDVDLDGTPAIVGGVFQPSYDGTIVYDPETTVTVTISTHPLFPGGPTPIDIDITDLAGHAASLNFTFSVADAVIAAETITHSEAVEVQVDYAPALAEAVTLTEVLSPSQAMSIGVQEQIVEYVEIETGSLNVTAINESTIKVSFPQELRFTGTSDLANFRIWAANASTYPVSLLSVERGFDTFASGSSAFLSAPEYSFFGWGAYLSEAQGSLSTGLSNVLWLGNTAPGLTAENVGDYIEILTGVSKGIYQIIDVSTEMYIYFGGDMIPIYYGEATRVLLDRPLIIKDPTTGYVEGLVEIVDELTNTVRLNSPLITESDPIIEFTYLQNRRTGHTLNALTIAYNPSVIEQVDYNTFNIYGILDSGFPVEAGDRIFAQVRVSPKLSWRHISGVQDLTFRTTHSPGTKLTGGGQYVFEGKNLRTKVLNEPLSFSTPFTASEATVSKPRVVAASITSEGVVVVRYDQPMRIDEDNLVNLADYQITGPTTVRLKRVYSVSSTEVGIETNGIGTGTYYVTVSTSTPKDVAGNPIDPLWNTVAFTAAAPLTPRSIFTDKGPIAKPELTLQSGVGGSITDYDTVSLPGAVLTSNHVGKRLRLSGGTTNAGNWRITSVPSSTSVTVQESFRLPDTDSHTWEVFDPRDGQIADDPTDVTVRINGLATTPVAVVGLMGQIVLGATPDPTDDVRIDYSCVCNPVVEIRRLNSREFRLNAWNRDRGYPHDSTQHKYRFNNVLVTPSVYEPDNPSAKLDQPQERELHYRAYERAYTPVLNDPTLLLLNSPIHRIAYPPSRRNLEESFILYEGIGLPENNVAYPWQRVGTGQASSASGVLTVEDDSSGVFPNGEQVFWRRGLDLTFPHVFAMSWRFSIDAVAAPEGVFTGLVAGFSDDYVVAVIGYIEDSGTKKVGFLKRGGTDDPAETSSWIGGLDTDGNPTNAPVAFDWSVLHSYRIFQGIDGAVKVYVDGDLDPMLQATRDELPFLEELNAPFDQLQGAFFGSVSRPAKNTSSWDFVRYLIQPSNPVQTSPSSFVSYEGNVLPEVDGKPWTPVGFHGTSSILSTDFLLLDSTSATNEATADEVGLVGGDFRGYVRFEPLLTISSEVVFDVGVQVVTHTHGVSPDNIMFAVDDGTRLMQIALFPSFSTPKLSYGGRSFPEDFAPDAWQVMGGGTAEMAGRILRITDASVSDGLVYYIEDNQPGAPFTSPSNDLRVVAADTDYMLEARCRVISYTVDGSNFAGAFTQVYDGTRVVGWYLEDDTGTKYVVLHSDGVSIGTRFAFDWNDGAFHTYRLRKSTSGNLVSLFIDGQFIGSAAYSAFTSPGTDPSGQVSFGSSTPASSGALSVVEWGYCNTWRLRSDQKRLVGLWKGTDADTLLGYHLPLKTSGRGARAQGNSLIDGNADYFALGVVAGDPLVVDSGPNRGVYEVGSVVSSTHLTIVGSWPSTTLVDYRIVEEVDWTTAHKLRLFRDSTGQVSILLDADSDPIIQVGYNSIDLPASGVGIVHTLSGGLPALVFGSFDPENLAQTIWDFARYGITRSVTEMRIVPHHEVINQWNVMHSGERLRTTLPHTLTDFKSSSTGIVPRTDPDFMKNPGLRALTVLNEDTPIVPQTQTFEIRAPYPTTEFVSALNRPEDVLNNDGDFTTNDGTIRYRLIVPRDVLYSSLDIIEQVDDGITDVIAPFTDECGLRRLAFTYQKNVCLSYDGSVLPENDTGAPTAWELVSDTPFEVSTTAFAGILTYTTAGSKTVYRNNTPLPDHPSLSTEVRFRLRLLTDWSAGTDDSQVRFGFSAPGMTMALAFKTLTTGDRFLYVLDQNSGAVLGAARFDYLDGAYHDYRIVRNPSLGTVQVFIDS